jgi:hypothetical protein
MTGIVVSERALILRINRKLHADDRVLRTTRGARAVKEWGRHHVRDWRLNIVVDDHVDVADLGRELGVLREWETLIENG